MAAIPRCDCRGVLRAARGEFRNLRAPLAERTRAECLPLFGAGWSSARPSRHRIAIPTTCAAAGDHATAGFLKGLQKSDQRVFVGVAEAQLLLEIVGAEIVSAIDNEIRALAHRQQVIDDVAKRLARILVACVLGQRLEVL